LLDSLLNLFRGKTGIGTGELLLAFPHKGHGTKYLFLHGPTLPKRLILKFTVFSACGEEGVYRIGGAGGEGGRTAASIAWMGA
jgi:hypothetical protein